MHDRYRTPAYWPTRIMLAVGFIGTAIVVLGAGALVMELGPCIGCDDSNLLGLPSYVLEAAVLVVLPAVGLVWMIRIFRGPRDRPPRWRYRHR